MTDEEMKSAISRLEQENKEMYRLMMKLRDAAGDISNAKPTA